MLLGFKTELKLNNKQRTLLLKHSGVARHAYNWGLGLTKQILDNNKNNPNDKIKFPSAIDLHKWLVALVKPNCSWYYEVSKSAPQFALRELRIAWDRCFKKISKAPRFKKKGRADSFSLDGSIRLEDFKVKLPRIGWIKTYERLPSNVNPKTITVSRHADKWFISFRVETSIVNTPKNIDVVGVDLGIKTLATLSTGKTFYSSNQYKKLEKKLRRLQYLNRNKLKGSANYKKAMLKIAKLHKKIADIRKDTLHKITSYIAKNHSNIVIEDLNVSGMMSNHKLARAVANMGFHEFKRQLIYKSELYNSNVVLADRWFPSSKLCSNCNHKKETLNLSERTYNCESCGFNCDRDLNASYNLRNLLTN